MASSLSLIPNYAEFTTLCCFIEYVCLLRDLPSRCGFTKYPLCHVCIYVLDILITQHIEVNAFSFIYVVLIHANFALQFPIGLL